MFKKYPSSGSPDAASVALASVNILGMLRTNVYFPTYSNGLKDVASFVEATWGGKISSGIECIARRLRWEESRDELIRSEITDYNRDDCLAVQAQLVHFLASLGALKDRPRQSSQHPRSPPNSPGRFGKIKFAIPEMDLINKCARFNYQREKVLVRTDPNVRASVRRKRAKKKHVMKANAEVRCGPPAMCPACGSKKVIESVKFSYSKLVYDLKFTPPELNAGWSGTYGEEPLHSMHENLQLGWVPHKREVWPWFVKLGGLPSRSPSTVLRYQFKHQRYFRLLL